jgi:hypothetical protein
MAAEHELLVMSVTRLGDGVCVACVDSQNRWIRPTREGHRGWRQLQTIDLRDGRGTLVVKVGNLVSWPLGRSAPREVHSEDVFVASACPGLIRALSPGELRSRYGELGDQDLVGFMKSPQRSLTLVKPAKVTRIKFSVEGKGGISARLTLHHQSRLEDLGITDLAWRALGRRLLTELKTASVSWSAAALQRATFRRIEYLAVGRGQAWEEGPEHALAGKYWPFVIGVFTEPPINERIDFSNL